MAANFVQPAEPRKWYQIWWDIWSHPGVASFQALLREPDHSIRRGLIWVALTSLFVGLTSSLLSARSIASIESGYGGTAIYYMCVLIATPIFGVLGIMISSGIFHWIARLMGGNGRWEDLLICSSAVTAPSAMITGVFSGLTFILLQTPVVLFIFWGLASILGIYGIVLYIQAIMAAENLSTGKAVLTYFIPVIIVGLLVLCALLALIPAYRVTG